MGRGALEPQVLPGIALEPQVLPGTEASIMQKKQLNKQVGIQLL